MDIVFGGAYQGKLDYARESFGQALTVHTCSEEAIDLPADEEILKDFHLLVLALVRGGQDPCAYVEGQWEVLKDKIIIADDISCGIVPLDAETRAFREAMGRVMVLLSRKAQSVTRVFCGIGMRLK